MSLIVDRVILILLSVLILMQSYEMQSIIIIGLSAVVVAGFSYFFDVKRVRLALGITYMVICIFYPALICMAPVIMYEFSAIGENVAIVVLALLSVFEFFNTDSLTIASILLIVFGEILACILEHKTTDNEKLHHLVNIIRDDSEEKNMLLAEKNKHLLEKQDQEIYVATLKERNRIAREIHDNVGHMLTRSILQMGALMTINKDEPLHGQLESVKNNLDVAMNNIRESVHDLHDDSVDMKQAIIDMMTELKERFECRLDYDVSNNIDRKHKYAIMGIVKEGISNIMKYSKNDKVDIIIREHPGMYQLIIWDYSSKRNTEENAIAQAKTGDGIGLMNMQERVSALKGNIVIDQSRGYKIFVTLPR